MPSDNRTLSVFLTNGPYLDAKNPEIFRTDTDIHSDPGANPSPARKNRSLILPYEKIRAKLETTRLNMREFNCLKDLVCTK